MVISDLSLVDKISVRASQNYFLQYSYWLGVDFQLHMKKTVLLLHHKHIVMNI